MSSAFTQVIKRNFRPAADALRDDIAKRKDKSFFWPCGTQVYCGAQGSGKTISAVKHTFDLKERYPQSIIVSNLDLKDLEAKTFKGKEDLEAILSALLPDKEYIQFSSLEELSIALVSVNNGFKGVIFLVDEIHTYFNALDSKNIPMYVFTEISQQRKQRKLIIGTSQLFLRMAKPFREQCDNLVICRTLFGILTTQKAFDGMSLEQDYDGSIKGDIRKKGFFFHTRKIRNKFDTYQKVISGSEQFEHIQKIEVMQPKKGLFKR